MWPFKGDAVCVPPSGQQVDIHRYCDVHSAIDFIDYLHSSPAALAVALTGLLGLLAFILRPLVQWLVNRIRAKARRSRLLRAFAMEVEHSLQNLEMAYSDEALVAWDRRFDLAIGTGETLIPFQSYSESDFFSTAVRAELLEVKPKVAELLVRYYANDSLIAAAIRDLRSELFAALSEPRRRAFFFHIFDLAKAQMATCVELKKALPHSRAELVRSALKDPREAG